MANNKTVATEHPDYAAAKDKWQRCRDAAAGQDAMRVRGMAYVPRLTDQDDNKYHAYLNRATFYNATKRTINGFTGMMFRKPEIIGVPAGIAPYLDDVTLGGEPLHMFVLELSKELYTVGRAGVLVDHPPLLADGIVTVARAEQLGLRPTLQRYTAESIINWKTGSVSNVTKLMMVVLTEAVTIGGDEFAPAQEKQYRVLDLVPTAQNGLVYRVRMFRINPKTEAQEQVGEDRFPLLNGRPMAEIPFFFLGVDSLTPSVELPPLIDLVDINIAHFRVSADYEHGCHFTGLPTAFVAGFMPANPQEKLYIGSTAAWIFTDPNTKVGFLEFTGQGLGALVENLDRKEAQMAAIGARLLAADKRMNETATTAAIHHGGETSILSAVAQVISLGITRALTTFAQWAGVDGEVDFDINRDFFPVPMDAMTLQALVGAWQAGAISAETLFDNLQEGEIINSDAEFEKEQAKIANAPPLSARMTTKSVAVKTASDTPAASGTAKTVA